MPIIVNLSSLHTLESISVAMDAFTDLCDKYSRSGCLDSCPRFFKSSFNKAWVGLIYQQNRKTLINPYKLGKMETLPFLDKLLEIFDFLRDEALEFDEEDRTRIEENREKYVITRGLSILCKEDIAMALLEEAWNSFIDFTESDKYKLEKLLKEAHKDSIYIVSNTNELNADKILSAIREMKPDISWFDVDLSVKADSDPMLQLAPNIYLCLSYKAHAFKTATDNEQMAVTTPTLLRQVVDDYDGEKSDIRVVSQYAKDLEEAEGLGIPKENLHEANHYFKESTKEARYIA